jgi:hypothetical protein
MSIYDTSYSHNALKNENLITIYRVFRLWSCDPAWEARWRRLVRRIFRRIHGDMGAVINEIPAVQKVVSGLWIFVWNTNVPIGFYFKLVIKRGCQYRDCIVDDTMNDEI